MAYPSTIDAFSTKADGDSIEASHVNSLQTAVEALEAKVGVDSSAVNTTSDFKLSEVTGGDKSVGKTATQTLTNKTLTSPTITSPTLNLGSDAEGDTYYRNSSGSLVRLARGTDNYIYKMNGNVPNWEAEATTVDASTTVKGVVEAATSSEVTAGTATGGTGAVLAVTPDALAASSPTFSGLNVSNTTRITTVAGYTAASDTSENTVFSTTITGNTLGANGLIKVRIPAVVSEDNGGSAGETFTIRLKFGGSTLQTGTVTLTKTVVGQSGYGFFDFWIINNAATNSQYVSFLNEFGIFTSNTAAPITFSHAADTTSAIDTTSNQTLALTVQRTDGTNGSLVFRRGLIETIKNA